MPGGHWRPRPSHRREITFGGHQHKHPAWLPYQTCSQMAILHKVVSGVAYGAQKKGPTLKKIVRDNLARRAIYSEEGPTGFNLNATNEGGSQVISAEVQLLICCLWEP